MSGMDRLTDEQLEYWSKSENGYRPQKRFVVAMARELLAYRRASQATPAPSDGLREALVEIVNIPPFHGVRSVQEIAGAALAAHRAALTPAPAKLRSDKDRPRLKPHNDR